MTTLILLAVLLSPILVGGAWIVFDLIKHIQKPQRAVVKQFLPGLRLDRAIDPNSLAFAIPEEFADLQPIVSEARLGEKDGMLHSFVTLSAQVPPTRINEFLRALMSANEKGK